MFTQLRAANGDILENDTIEASLVYIVSLGFCEERAQFVQNHPLLPPLKNIGGQSGMGRQRGGSSSDTRSLTHQCRDYPAISFPRKTPNPLTSSKRGEPPLKGIVYLSNCSSNLEASLPGAPLGAAPDLRSPPKLLK